MKKFAGLAILFISSSVRAQRPQNKWIVVNEPDSACRYSVPANWMLNNPKPGISESPDGKTAVVPQNVKPGESFSNAKKQLEQQMPPLQVREDSPNFFRYVYHDPADGEDSPDTHWYVAVQRNGHVCAARITFETARGESIPKRIAASLAPSQ